MSSNYLIADNQILQTKLAAAEAENARLREALALMAEGEGSDAAVYQAIARAALKGEK